LHGARSLKSLQDYPRAYCVIVGLVQTRSPIFEGHYKDASSVAEHEAPAAAQDSDSHADAVTQDPAVPVKSANTAISAPQSEHSASAFMKQWNALDDALDNGVITKAEYDRKVAALMAQRRATQEAAN
jgi:hypothetical protein